jgi:hypothetical protein
MSFRNGVLFQAFHWYSPADGSFWDETALRAPELARAGFTAVWLPPAYKGTGGTFDVGDFCRPGGPTRTDPNTTTSTTGTAWAGRGSATPRIPRRWRSS